MHDIDISNVLLQMTCKSNLYIDEDIMTSITQRHHANISLIPNAKDL